MTTLLAYIALLLPSYEVKETVYRTASVYSDYYEGRRTASGDVFSQDGMTCASNDFPLGTRLRLEHGSNVVWVTVNDRMARRFDGKRIDLARKPWLMLEEKADGLHHGVKVEVIEWKN